MHWCHFPCSKGGPGPLLGTHTASSESIFYPVLTRLCCDRHFLHQCPFHLAESGEETCSLVELKLTKVGAAKRTDGTFVTSTVTLTSLPRRLQ